MRSVIALLMAAALLLGAAAAQASAAKPGTLEHLIATRQVIDTVNQLFILTDQREWAALKKVFAPKVRFGMTSLGAKKPEEMTPQQITSAWDAGLKHLKAIHHQTGNYVVDFDASGAKVFCYGIASHYLPNPSGKNVRTFVGTYDLHLIRAGEGWQIDGFKFNLKYLDGNLNLEGKK